jgi:endonuclease/exonuclease/phosphatase (EEP) superfamily protein YafD
VAVIVCQATVILPYTPLWPVELLRDRDQPNDSSVRIMVANVLMPNRRTDRLLGLIRDHDPDILLAVETDAWWCEQLETLAATYLHRLSHPPPRQHLRDATVLGVQATRPRDPVPPQAGDSLDPHTSVRLRSGQQVRFCGLHPEPTSPTARCRATPS